MANKRSASRLHQTLVEMIRGKPGLGLVLLDAAGAPASEQATADATSEALSPALDDYHPDGVLLVRDGAEIGPRVLVVEVQLRVDKEKAFSLPVYQALNRRRHRAPCDVLVLATRAKVAAWYRQPIELGSGSVFRALVVGPEELGRVRDRSLRVEVAFLHAVARGPREPALVLRAARMFDDLLPEERAALYFDVVLDVLPASTRRQLEILMEKAHLEFRSEFMRGLVKKGLEKGQTEGRAKGLAEGRAEGRAEGLRAAIRAVLAAREIVLSKKDERALAGCDDLHVLEEWARRAARASTAREVFEPTPRQKKASPRSRQSTAGGSARHPKRSVRASS